MRRGLLHIRAGVVLLFLGASVLGLSPSVQSGEPKIDLIERFQTNYVLIHFDTEANLTYELQYTETLTANGVPGGTWTNLFGVNTDSPNHYVVVDTGMRPQRFYRLHVTP